MTLENSKQSLKEADRRFQSKCFDVLTDSRWTSTLNLKTSYWQGLSIPKIKKTAMSSGNDLYKFKVTVFGLCNAPPTFDHRMEFVLRSLLSKNVWFMNTCQI